MSAKSVGCELEKPTYNIYILYIYIIYILLLLLWLLLYIYIYYKPLSFWSYVHHLTESVDSSRKFSPYHAEVFRDPNSDPISKFRCSILESPIEIISVSKFVLWTVVINDWIILVSVLSGLYIFTWTTWVSKSHQCDHSACFHTIQTKMTCIAVLFRTFWLLRIWVNWTYSIGSEMVMWRLEKNWRCLKIGDPKHLMVHHHHSC